MVSIFFNRMNIPKSSTKREQSMSFTHLTMSLILMPNRVGDKILPVVHLVLVRICPIIYYLFEH